MAVPFDGFDDTNRTFHIPDEFDELAGALDANNIAGGNVTNEMFDYLEGVESNIQDQINAASTSGGTSESISGSVPQSIPNITVTSGTVEADDTSNITVSGAVGTEASYFSRGTATDQDKIVMEASGTYRLYGTITANNDISSSNDRTGPSFTVEGDNTNVIGWSNPYNRDADTDLSVSRFVDFVVESPQETLQLRVINRDIASGTFTTQNLGLQSVSSLNILPLGGTKTEFQEYTFEATLQDETDLTGYGSWKGLGRIATADININNGGFTVATTTGSTPNYSTITIPAAGRYMISASMYLHNQTDIGGSGRVQPQIQVARTRAGTTTRVGPVGLSYIRGTDEAAEGVSLVNSIYDFEEDDVIHVQAIYTADSGTNTDVDLDGDLSSISVIGIGIPAGVVSGGGGVTDLANVTGQLDANNIGGGNVSNPRFNQLRDMNTGQTATVQQQLNSLQLNKQNAFQPTRRLNAEYIAGGEVMNTHYDNLEGLGIHARRFEGIESLNTIEFTNSFTVTNSGSTNRLWFAFSTLILYFDAATYANAKRLITPGVLLRLYQGSDEVYYRTATRTVDDVRYNLDFTGSYEKGSNTTISSGTTGVSLQLIDTNPTSVRAAAGIVVLTTTEYNALATKDPDTLYFTY